MTDYVKDRNLEPPDDPEENERAKRYYNRMAREEREWNRFAYDAHNREFDCDCILCREFRREAE